MMSLTCAEESAGISLEKDPSYHFMLLHCVKRVPSHYGELWHGHTSP